MRYHVLSDLFLVILVASPLIAGPIANETTRENRFFDLSGIDLAFSRCGIKFLRCPANCATDEAVVLGYCCGCSDYHIDLPIFCPYDLDCPYYPDHLCSDYEYVMDCCC